MSSAERPSDEMLIDFGLSGLEIGDEVVTRRDLTDAEDNLLLPADSVASIGCWEPGNRVTLVAHGVVKGVRLADIDSATTVRLYRQTRVPYDGWREEPAGEAP